jgi:two-component system chemotaxis sensor kinase CheA
MSNEMDDVLREFLEESRENLDRVDVDLVALEKNPDATDIVARIFRAVHTIKGTCGFLGFTRLEAVTHAGENVLSSLRDQAISTTPALTSVLLRLVDAIREMLTKIEGAGTEGDGDYSDLIADMTRLYRGEDAGAAESAEAAPVELESSLSELPVPENIASLSMTAAVLSEPAAPAQRAVAARPSPMRVYGAPSAPPTPPPAKPAAVAAERAPSPAAPVATPVAAPVAAAPAGGGNAASPGGRPGAASGGEGSESKADTSIRVDVGLLDKLMNLVGELVLARNQIIQFNGGSGDATFFGAKQRLNLITSELQEGVMKTRMQPIGNIWHKFPRVVRDLATSCEKRVRLEMEGEQTELDKTLIEAIKDPLTHLVRNSVDHGIERPAERVAAGKAAEGCLRLRAFHEGGQVNIEVSDDGAGLDGDRIRQKAIERGLLTADQAARLGERDLFQLIFLPGFSTAAKVTNVSGRGVGMDVVRTNIEKIGGTIDLQSRRGNGTTMVIKIPLTLAIIRGVIVTLGKNRYVIPQLSVLKLIRLEGQEARRSVEMIHGAPVYRLRGKLLPLVYLDRVLEAPERSDDEVINIVVLKADNRQFGVVVDSVQDTEEIVVKPLGKHLKATSVFAGATIMGDGLVALILDVLGLAQRANVVAEGDVRGRQDLTSASAGAEVERQTLLLVRSPGDGRLAIPLSRIERLEEFPRTVLERVGSELVMQYRGEIMPVLDLKAVLVERRSRSRVQEAEAAAPLAPSQTLHVVVCMRDNGNVGLIVEQIVDIVEDALAEPRPAGRPGMLGSVVIVGRVTELLDVDAILRCAGPNGVSLPPFGVDRAMEVAQHGA